MRCPHCHPTIGSGSIAFPCGGVNGWPPLCYNRIARLAYSRRRTLMVWQKNYGDPGASPGTLAPLRDAAPHVVVTAIHYTAEEYTETQVTDLQAYLQQVPRDGVVWFNVDGLGDMHILEILGVQFGLHPLSL